MLNIAVTGAAGRMGRTLIQACYESAHCQLGAAIEHESSPFIGHDAGEMAGLGRLDTQLVTQLSEVAKNFDTLSMYSNFLILPLTYLGGVFYPISILPTPWSNLSHLNPMFY